MAPVKRHRLYETALHWGGNCAIHSNFRSGRFARNYCTLRCTTIPLRASGECKSMSRLANSTLPLAWRRLAWIEPSSQPIRIRETECVWVCPGEQRRKPYARPSVRAATRAPNNSSRNGHLASGVGVLGIRGLLLHSADGLSVAAELAPAFWSPFPQTRGCTPHF